MSLGRPWAARALAVWRSSVQPPLLCTRLGSGPLLHCAAKQAAVFRGAQRCVLPPSRLLCGGSCLGCGVLCWAGVWSHGGSETWELDPGCWLCASSWDLGCKASWPLPVPWVLLMGKGDGSREGPVLRRNGGSVFGPVMGLWTWQRPPGAQASCGTAGESPCRDRGSRGGGKGRAGWGARVSVWACAAGSASSRGLSQVPSNLPGCAAEPWSPWELGHLSSCPLVLGDLGVWDAEGGVWA